MRGSSSLSLVDLAYKEHGSINARTSYDSLCGYRAVEQPSNSQKILIDVVSQEITDGWIYRQLRDGFNKRSLGDNDLYRGSSDQPLILVYQRQDLIPQKRDTLTEEELESARNRSPIALESIVERITTFLPKRYSLERAYAQYEEWYITREGSGLNTNILLMHLYFSDKAEEIQPLKKELKRLEQRLARASSGPVMFQGRDLSKHRLRTLPGRISELKVTITTLENEYL